MARVIVIGLISIVLTGCSTFAPVSTGKNTYLIEGGVGLVGAPMTMMAERANEFCASKGLQMTVLGFSPWVPGRDTPKLQFSCTAEAAPVQLRPDNGITTIQSK
jgi:hypothetical protein